MVYLWFKVCTLSVKNLVKIFLKHFTSLLAVVLCVIVAFFVLTNLYNNSSSAEVEFTLFSFSIVGRADSNQP